MTKEHDHGNKLLNLCYVFLFIMLNGRNKGCEGKITFIDHTGKSAVVDILCNKWTLYKIKRF